MAITAPSSLIAGTGTSGNPVTTFTSASFTPGANTTLIAIGGTTQASPTAAPVPTVTDSAGLSWQDIGSVVSSDAATPGLALKAWKAKVGGSPSSMTVTINSSNARVLLAGVASLLQSEIDTDATWQVASGEDLANGDPAFTFGTTVASTSAVFGTTLHGGSNLITQPTGFTELFEGAAVGTRKLEAFYDVSSPASTGQVTSTNLRAIVLAFEIPVAAAGAYSLTVTAASASIGGQAVNLKAAKLATVTGGTVAASGQAVTVARGYTRAVNAAPVAVTGQPAGLLIARKLSIASQGASASGQAVGLVRALTLAISPGGVSASGQSIGLLAHHRLTVGSLDTTATGQTVNLGKSSASVLAVMPAAVSLSGGSVTLRVARKAGVNAGAAGITGASIGIAAGRLIWANATSVTIAESAIGIRCNRGISIASAAVTISGAAVALSISSPGNETPVPSERMASLVAENRNMQVAAESRFYTVAGESRTASVR